MAHRHSQSRQLESADGDDLALDVRAVDEDAVVVDDVHDDSDLALLGAVVDAHHAAHFDEFGEGLSLWAFFTIGEIL